jgi:tetratricopeptide (TPR) repeat protein
MNAGRAAPTRTNTRIALGVALALVALNVFVYAPVRHFDFVNWDDDTYVRQNAVVLAGLTWRGLIWAFTTGHDPYWHPLTWISHMVDVQIFGTHAGGHHVTNVLLSIANTLLLFTLLRRLTRAIWPSAFVAALFAVHPLRVESVAWIAERKDLLSAFFLLLTIGAYARYVDRPGRARFAAVSVMFALGLMAKPMLVTVPFALLLLDYWPLERPARLWTLIVEKIPLLVLALIVSVLTLLVQQHADAVADFTVLPLSTRLGHALVAYVAYIGKMLWPFGLAAFYPYPRATPAWWLVGGAAALLVAVSVAAARARAHRYLLFGWAWYLVTLVPVIGLVQSGDQSMADRFTYIPLVGLFVIAAWGGRDLLGRGPAGRVSLSIGALTIVVVCAGAARVQVGYWKDGATLWTRALEVTPDNHRAHGSLGDLLASQGRYREAIDHYQEAVRLAPTRSWLRRDLARALMKDGQIDRAIGECSIAVRIEPTSPEAHVDLGAALALASRTTEAIAQYTEALRLKPDYALAHNNLAIALAAVGQLQDAIEQEQEALRLGPAQAEWHFQLGVFLYRAGRVPEAVQALEAALRLDPGLEGARQALEILKRQR